MPQLNIQSIPNYQWLCMEPIFTFSDVQNGADLHSALWEERRGLEFHPQQESQVRRLWAASKPDVTVTYISRVSEGLTLTGTPEIWGGMAGGG